MSTKVTATAKAYSTTVSTAVRAQPPSHPRKATTTTASTAARAQPPSHPRNRTPTTTRSRNAVLARPFALTASRPVHPAFIKYIRPRDPSAADEGYKERLWEYVEELYFWLADNKDGMARARARVCAEEGCKKRKKSSAARPRYQDDDEKALIRRSAA